MLPTIGGHGAIPKTSLRCLLSGYGTANQRADCFTVDGPLDVALFRVVEHQYRHVVFRTLGNRRLIHDS